jgi:hypothetical protein
LTKDLWAEFWVLMNTPQSEINLEILYTTTNLILAAAAAYIYKIRRQQAEQLYGAPYPPQSKEEKERWVRKKEWHLKLFYGTCFWIAIGLACMWLYFYIRPLKGSN